MLFQVTVPVYLLSKVGCGSPCLTRSYRILSYYCAIGSRPPAFKTVEGSIGQETTRQESCTRYIGSRTTLPLSSSMPESERPEDTQGKQSCVPYFDALWFCYCGCCCFVSKLWPGSELDLAVLSAAPVYQFQHYYKFGKADDCSGQWSNLYSCLKSRTKFKVQVPKLDKLHARRLLNALLSCK